MEACPRPPATACKQAPQCRGESFCRLTWGANSQCPRSLREGIFSFGDVTRKRGGGRLEDFVSVLAAGCLDH
eukprot:3404124-Alexandrium_andersonii.AAC.1